MKKLSLFLMTAFVAGSGFCMSDENSGNSYNHRTQNAITLESRITKAWDDLHNDLDGKDYIDFISDIVEKKR